MKMFLNFILTAILAVTFSCKKDTDTKSATQLLTQKTWILVSYGYDHNANGMIDAAEESIRDCDKDNNYTFNTDGTGIVEDNALICGSGFSEMPFTWRLTNNETNIDFLTGIVTILRLREEQLIISYHKSTGALSPRYIETFKH